MGRTHPRRSVAVGARRALPGWKRPGDRAGAGSVHRPVEDADPAPDRDRIRSARRHVARAPHGGFERDRRPRRRHLDAVQERQVHRGGRDDDAAPRPDPALQDALLAEACRVLRPGSWLVGVDSLDSPPFRTFHDGDVCVPVDPSTLEPRLRAAGFTEIEIERREHAFRFAGRRPPTRKEPIDDPALRRTARRPRTGRPGDPRATAARRARGRSLRDLHRQGDRSGLVGRSLDPAPAGGRQPARRRVDGQPRPRRLVLRSARRRRGDVRPGRGAGGARDPQPRRHRARAPVPLGRRRRRTSTCGSCRDRSGCSRHRA